MRIVIIIVVKYFSFFSKLFNNKIEQNLLISIFSFILILFVFGLFNCLHVGFMVIIILNIGVLIHNLFGIVHKKFKSKNIVTFGFIIFLACYLMAVYISHERVAYLWDEFSHWALVVKNMFYLNNFGLGSDSTVLYKSYLSGTSLFQYFCMKLSGDFNESMLYLGMNTMIIAAIVPMFSVLEKKKAFLNYILEVIK